MREWRARNLATADESGNAGGAGGRCREFRKDAHGEVGEGLRLQHVAVETDGFHGLYRAGEAKRKFGHQGGVVAATAGDEEAGDGCREVARACGHGGGGGSGEGGCGIGVREVSDGGREAGKIVAVQ